MIFVLVGGARVRLTEVVPSQALYKCDLAGCNLAWTEKDDMRIWVGIMARIITKHTNSSSIMSWEDVKVVMMKFVAVIVFVNKAPQALMAFTRTGCVLSILHVGWWSSGICVLNSVKNRYTGSLIISQCRVVVVGITTTYDIGSTPRWSDFLRPRRRK